MTFPGLTDREIWSLFKQGDDRSLAFIYSSNASKLYHYGLKFIADKELVEDAIQDLFIELMKSRKNLGDTDNILFYLFKAFKRKILRKMHRERHQFDEQFLENQRFEISWSVEHQFMLQEISFQQKNSLLQALNNLTNRQKEAIYLRYTRELDYRSVAGIMEISVEASRNLICNAIRKMKKSLLKSEENSLILFLHSFLKNNPDNR